MSYWVGYFLILIVVGGGLITPLVYLYRNGKSDTWFMNITIVVLSLFAVVMLLEFYFKVFYAEPDAFDTLARQNWRDRYANREMYNSLGYRDFEWTEEKVSGKTKVMIVGDSFVYGDGIENVEDRFSNRLAQKLGSEYVVFNLGRGGTNTKHHIEAIINYPYSPDILILSYVFNDIQGSATEQQWLNRPHRPGVSPLLAPMVNNSYAFNFVYWRLFHLLQIGQSDTTWDWYLSLYNDPESWWTHEQQLVSIYEGAQAEQIPFIFVIFPSMDYPEKTQVVVEQVKNVYQERDVPILDVTDLIRDIPKDQLMVSKTDAHPSELVNALVADALYELMVVQGLVE